MNARPIFHFTARRGWINDPHGITHRDGGYHSFFQFVPDSDRWQPNCHWGHAAGADLFDLQELEVAIAPGEGDDGIWTGSILLSDPHDPLSARAFYTSVNMPDFAIGRVRVARPVDLGWTSWVKEHIVVPAPPRESAPTAFRDPFLVRDGDRLWALVGAALPGKVAGAIAYEIDADGVWWYRSVAAERSSSERAGTWTGSMWECPQLIRLTPDDDVLLTSVWDDDVLHYAAYGIGTWSDGRFECVSWRRLSYGPSYYAPSTFVDEAGRDCVIFWMREIRAADGSWTGAHSIPYVIEPTESGMALRIHPDLERYRVPSAGRSIGDSAAQLEWTPQPDGELRLDIGEPLTISAASQGTTVVYGDEKWTIPGSAARVDVVIDGCVVEIVTDYGILGFPVAPVHHVRVSSGDGFRAWRLEKG